MAQNLEPKLSCQEVSAVELTYEQLWFTTQEIEQMYFYGIFSPECYETHFDISSVMPSGTYRVIDGELFQIVDGIPPEDQ